MAYTPTEWETADIVTAARMNALETAVGEMNMSYTPNTWSDGDILTAAKMNALEQAVASGGGGGGNPNTMQTITGTLANPFGSVDADTLGTALDSMNASATFVADASALGAGTVVSRLGGDNTGIWGNGASFGFNDSVTAFGLQWDASGSLTFAEMFSGGSVMDISPYGSMIPTTLTIVWHPLAE